MRYLLPSHPQILYVANRVNVVYKVGFANICKESLLFTFSVCVPFVLLFVSTVMNVLFFEKLRDGEGERLCPLLNPTK